ncbi:transducin/WD40 repeat-like superfamily protein [Wolffia australiana]
MADASSSSFSGFSQLAIPLFSVVLGAALVLYFFSKYFNQRKAEVASIAVPQEPKPTNQKPSKQSFGRHNLKKSQARSHSNVSNKSQIKPHHPLEVNTLKGHGDSVTAVSFSSDGRSLATACADGVVRVFKIEDVSSKNFKLLRINLPAGAQPTAIAFSDGSSTVVVAAQVLSGSSLFAYGDVSLKPAGESFQQAKPSLPEVKWEHQKVHDQMSVITLFGAVASYGTADGSTIIVSCSEGTEIKLWHGKSGKNLGTVNTNQLKNSMATVSPNGRFLAAAAFTADVKVWEINYSKDGSVKEISRAMQLKGHENAVTWLCFTPDSEKIITASKDKTIRIWNIKVRYHLDEDPKTLKVFPIPLCDAKGSTLIYDRMSLSPDGQILAAVQGSTLQWICVETGKVLDTVESAHEGEITSLAWTPQRILFGASPAFFLATAGSDKKAKLWSVPALSSS